MDSEAVSLMTIIKAAIGPFVGAMLAFGATWAHDARRARQEHIAAGNLALTTINSMYNEFLLFRLGTYTDAADPERSEFSPRWARLKPSAQTFGDYEIDRKSLAFLFEDPEALEAINETLLAELTYRDMIAMCELRNEVADAIYKEVSAFETYEEAEEHFGPQRIGMMMMATRGILLRAASDESVYVDAYKTLRGALLNKLTGPLQIAPMLVNRVTVKARFQKQNLPQLPQAVQDILAEAEQMRAQHSDLPSEQEPPDGEAMFSWATPAQKAK